MPTIYDVAAAAGVATSTVSRTFARPDRVNAETAQRIRAIAADLGYRGNSLARGLISGRTQLIALVLPDVTNAFYNDIIRGAEIVSRDADYTIALIDSQESDELEHDSLERALPIVDGIVLASSRMSDAAIRMMSKKRPTVVLNRVVPEVASVVVDNVGGIRLALEHLAELGHRKVLYVAAPEAAWSHRMRWQAVQEFGGEFGLECSRTGPFAPSIAGGSESASAVTDSSATAVITFNDWMAVGLIKELSLKGTRVPGGVSVMGFDNVYVADLITPGLTTIAAPWAKQGETAIRTLLTMFRSGRPRTGEPVVLPVRLVRRASTAPPP